jgi:hypothetical protein
MAGARLARKKKSFKLSGVLNPFIKTLLNSLYGRLAIQNTCTTETQHRTETLIHNADEKRKQLHSFQVVPHSMTAMIGCSFGIGSPCSFRSGCCSDLSYLFS